MPADLGGGDRALVARVADGDGAALGALYDRYGRTLFSLAYRILGDGDDAEEVVMDAMEQAWRSAADYSPERGSVAAWLVVLVRSRALDRLRARRRQARALDRAWSLEPEAAPGMGSTLEGAGAAAEAGDRRSRVLAALRQLPESQRVCLELAYYEGLTQTQIAARLDEPLGTVKTRMRLGLIKLRESLQPAIMELEA
jgi:RNA polymerase sigma-70 factor (ECF subfamily)